jgi:hypothetical protein
VHMSILCNTHALSNVSTYPILTLFSLSEWHCSWHQHARREGFVLHNGCDKFGGCSQLGSLGGKNL